MGLYYSEGAGYGDDKSADVDVHLAGDMEKEYATTGVVVCLAGAPVELDNLWFSRLC